VSINSIILSSSPPIPLHDVVRILATANNNGGVGVTLELRSLQRREGDQPKIVFLTDDSSDHQLLTARTLSMPPPPSSPAVHAPIQERAQTLGALPYRAPAPAPPAISADAIPVASASLARHQAIGAAPNLDTHNGSVAETVVGSTISNGEDSKVEASIVTRMAARIQELERELEVLRRENATLRDAVESAKVESSLSRQQSQSHREDVRDVGPVLNTPGAGVLPVNYVIPPVPNNAPPNAPTLPIQLAQATQHPSPPDLLVPSMFHQQLAHQSHAQMQHLQMQQQQMAQRQQQPISRPGPALASTFDALSYTSRDGLKLPALDLPRLLSPHTNVHENPAQAPLPSTR
jgi:hypothetical protein